MNSEQLISIHLEAYRSLCASLGKDNEESVRLYSKLKDMIVVEIYFMKSIRCLLKEEEMAGFVIFVNDDIRTILDNYKGSRGCFMTYLKESMEHRAMSYLDLQMQTVNMRRAFLEFKGAGSFYIDEKTPEDMLCVSETASEQRVKQMQRFNMIRYMCIMNPVRRKKLFTFFCTIVPFLSLNIIDRFCETINCDRKQALAIAGRLCLIHEKEDHSRYSRSYQKRMVDYHWAKILEYEGHAMIALDPDSQKAKADYHRALLKESLSGLIKSKMNVNYSVVAGILNLDPTTVALHVLHSKQMLERILVSSPPRNMIRLAKRGNRELPRFMPFEVYGIRKTEKPA